MAASWSDALGKDDAPTKTYVSLRSSVFTGVGAIGSDKSLVIIEEMSVTVVGEVERRANRRASVLVKTLARSFIFGFG